MRKILTCLGLAMTFTCLSLHFAEASEPSDVVDVGFPRLIIKGFSDLGYRAKITDSNRSNTFALGAVDFFISSEITDRISFLYEMNIHPDPDGNSMRFHIERANLRYSISDLLSIKIGRIHTPLGYWNQAYHHGAWLQTTIFRPAIYLWEHDGGILPVHSVGIELFGVKEFSVFDLEYYIDVVNGRGRTITEVQDVADRNSAKAINALFIFKPYFATGLNLGVNFYIDRIPSNPADSSRTKEINELILGGYASYFNDRLEFLGELFDISHDDQTSGKEFNTIGLYLQAGYKIAELTPFYRFDFIDFGQGDPYFADNDIDMKKHTLGLKWDIFSWNALKLEYSFSDLKNGNDEHSFTVNSSFTF